VGRYETKLLAVENRQAAHCGTAKRVRLLQDCVEYRRKVAGRGVDDLQDLGSGGLLSERLVTLGSALGKLALQIGYELFGIG